MEFPLESHDDFGRIASQTAKQVVLQKLKEAERGAVIKEFQNKVDEIVSGIVQRFDRGNVFIDLGRATGILFSNECIPGEHYKSGDRMRFYVVAVQEESKIPGIILSRSHPKFVSKLFQIEVPEINDGTVEINAIAREPGSRSKIAVSSLSNHLKLCSNASPLSSRSGLRPPCSQGSHSIISLASNSHFCSIATPLQDRHNRIRNGLSSC